MFTNPTSTDFRNFFFRDFPYGTTLDTVQDQDITKAIGQAAFNFNPALFSTQSNYTLGYLYLTAHYLVIDLRASSQGLAGSYTWLTASKGVGSVNESFAIPQRMMDNPYLAMLSKTQYGAKYLSLVLPSLIGQMFVSCEAVQP